MSQRPGNSNKTAPVKNASKEVISSRSSSTPEFHLREQLKVFHCLFKGNPVDDESIFIETHENGEKSGHLYHVRGDMYTGMTFDHKKTRRIEDEKDFASKSLIGTVSESTTRSLRKVIRSVQVPGRQYNKRHQKLNIGPIRGGKEWTAEVIAELRSKRLLQRN